MLTRIEVERSWLLVAAMILRVRQPLPQHRQIPIPLVTGLEIGVGPFALFDIVNLDEGTCGRRPRVLRLQGVRCSGNQISRSNLISLKLRFWCGLETCPIHVSIRKYDIVQERLLEMSGALPGYSTWSGIGHQT